MKGTYSSSISSLLTMVTACGSKLSTPPVWNSCSCCVNISVRMLWLMVSMVTMSVLMVAIATNWLLCCRWYRDTFSTYRVPADDHAHITSPRFLPESLWPQVLRFWLAHTSSLLLPSLLHLSLSLSPSHNTQVQTCYKLSIRFSLVSHACEHVIVVFNFPISDEWKPCVALIGPRYS